MNTIVEMQHVALLGEFILLQRIIMMRHFKWY